MKITRLLNLLLALTLVLGTAQTAHTAGPLNEPDGADTAAHRPPDFVASKPVKLQDSSFGLVQDESFSDLSNLSAASATQSPASNWRIETVDSIGNVGNHTSLAMDEEGRPRISYYDETNGDLKYARYDGMNWQIETVDNDGDVGLYTSLVLDKSGLPHISYYDQVNGDLKYAHYDGMIWQIETVDSIGNVGEYTSLVLDGTDYVHISYYDRTNNNLKYVRYDGMTWEFKTVDGVGSDWGCSSLALDEVGRPHVSYRIAQYFDSAIKYAWYDGSAWQIETVETWWFGSVGDCPSLSLDRSGQPHISYATWTRVGPFLTYAQRDGASWQIETIDNTFIVACSNTSLTLDELDRPHISCHLGGFLGYTWYDETTWQAEAVDDLSNDQYTFPSLILDAADRPHISYYDQVNGDLKYTRLMPFPVLSKYATPSHGLRNNDPLTYTLVLSGPGLNVRLWDPLPPNVRYVSGSLTGTVTPTAVYSPTAHAIIWEGKLPTDTVQTVRFQVTRGFTGTGSLDLSLPIVNTAWLTNTDSGWSVSDTVIVNGYRRYLPLVMIDD